VRRRTTTRLQNAIVVLAAATAAFAATPTAALAPPKGAHAWHPETWRSAGEVKRFIEEEFRLHPERATDEGDHRFD
jgi:hypothetical protein